jgi:hypothetical protein
MKRFLIPIAALLLVPSWLRADEIPSGYTLSEDGRVIRESELPRTRITKAAWLSECGKNIYPRECARIKRKDAERDRERRRERVYAADRRDIDEDRGPRRSCEATVSAEGKKVWKLIGKGQARSEARLQWEREVISKYGERYADPNYARTSNGDGYSCWEVGRSFRCSLTARPCRAG